MTMNPLPPQAYTKDTMLKAYQWLMLQNSSIKEMATTPDILVSLYLKATRDGDAALDRPSIKNFKNELRSLAGMMGELDGKKPAPQSAPEASPAPQVAVPEKALSPTANMPSILEQLDECSLEMIREVKSAFNLSSELEAVRMLIKIGHGRAQSLLR